ncbi:MAG TPA: hypothetical protein VJU18_03610 [Vicinamibacteria bacterium]|nr:hypothetical protein [Vicinamibacteria bacterium]
MAKRPARELRRKSFFVDEAALKRAREALSAESDAEAVRLSLTRIAEMEAFWKFMQASRKSLRPGSFGTV